MSGWDSSCHQDDRPGRIEKLWPANCSVFTDEFPLTFARDDVLSPAYGCSKLCKCPFFHFVPSIVPMYSLRTEDMAGFDQEVATLSKCDALIAKFTFKVKCESFEFYHILSAVRLPQLPSSAIRCTPRFRHPNLVTLIGWGKHYDLPSGPQRCRARTTSALTSQGIATWSTS